ncbi:MAG TPA: hypothetical protein VHG89_09075, partial [Verrucomicrobiae bacterium]|nr:hypothetical protein [Verrucomicrobiae bacterium]
MPMGILPKLAWTLGSLAPVTACLLLSLSAFNSGNGISINSTQREPLIALLSSNQSYSAFLLGSSGERENKWSSITFDWTNRSGLPSSMPSFPRN